YRGDGALPGPEEVTQSLDRVGYRHVQLDAATRTVRFLRPGIDLDPGGIGKGYAVDRMVDVLKSRGIATALVSAAGSSIYGLGAPPEDPNGWRINISAPGDPGRHAAEVYLRNMSISTSGSYEKFFEAEGRRYSHVLDPRTGYPAQGAAAVSVMAPRALDSEAWTKPYFVNGPEWAEAHGPKHLRVFYCAEATDERCAWIQ
ncbi:MAG: FAD:protein FMN transferase, partial [Acidobacteria bacterium]|nr:FAD:protein FMN transferase [Acidobacteriota bacterium]